MRRLLLVLLAGSLWAPIARAEDPPPPDRSVERFQAGAELLREERYEEAAAAFRESYRLAPRVATMCNLALTYDRWGSEHRARAVRAYRTCARDDESGRFRAYAEQRVQAIERELALEDAGAAGDARPPPAPAEPTDAEPTETGPTDAGPTDAGPTDAGATETVAAPEEPEAAPEPPRDRAALYAGVAVAGVSVAAFVAGVVLALDASATVDDLVASYGMNPRIVRGSPDHARYDQARERAITATALYVAAGVAAATAIALITVDLALDDETSVALSGSGIAVRRAF